MFISSLTFITKENENLQDEIIKIINDGTFSKEIINKATNNYKNKYNENKDILTLASSISKYAETKNKNGDINADETIAEAVHDYYLHKQDANKYSIEIVKVLKEKLGDSV